MYALLAVFENTTVFGSRQVFDERISLRFFLNTIEAAGIRHNELYSVNCSIRKRRSALTRGVILLFFRIEQLTE